MAQNSGGQNLQLPPTRVRHPLIQHIVSTESSLFVNPSLGAELVSGTALAAGILRGNLH
jgi:hypothetical protein